MCSGLRYVAISDRDASNYYYNSNLAGNTVIDISAQFWKDFFLLIKKINGQLYLRRYSREK